MRMGPEEALFGVQMQQDRLSQMMTARRHEQPQDLALGRSSLAIPVIKVITAIYYLGPHSPKYSLAGLCRSGVNTCMGFKCPALLPLQGWDKSRDGDWLELLLLPEPGKDELQPCKTPNCHIFPWPGSAHSMKRPHTSAGMLLRQGGDPMISTDPTPPPSQTQHPQHLQTGGCLASTPVSSVGLIKGEIKYLYKTILQPASGTVLPFASFHLISSLI